MSRPPGRRSRSSGGWRLAVLFAVLATGALAGPAAAQSAPAAGPPSSSSRTVAWELGSKLGLAAVGHASGATAKTVASVLGNAKVLAAAVPVDVPEMPARTGDRTKDSAAAIQYLIKQAGEPIGKTLRDKYDVAHAALFEMAAKSQLLLLLYAPGDSLGTSLVTVIRRNAPRADLPENLWKPVADKVEAAATFDQVKAAVTRMHADVSKHLEGNP